MLEHARPTTTASQTSFAAVVDVNLLLATLQTTDTQVGEWVNVVGYIEGKRTRSTGRRGGGGGGGGGEEEGEEEEERGGGGGGGVGGGSGGGGVIGVKVQAMMLWSAESVNLGEYEHALVERQKSPEGMKA